LFDAEGIPRIFSDGIVYTFPPGTVLSANNYLLIEKDPVSFASQYSPPGGVDIFGSYLGSINNEGEKLVINFPGDVYRNGELQYIRMDRVVYDNDAPDGSGTSLNRTVNSDYGNDVANWISARPTTVL